MITKAFDRLVVAKYIETLHWTGEDAFGCYMNFTEAEKVVGSESFMDACIVSHKLIELIMAAEQLVAT